MISWEVFNVAIGENVDCRAFYKDLNGQWRRLGGDEYNNVEFCLNCDEVETLAREEGFSINDLYLESDLYQMWGV